MSSHEPTAGDREMTLFSRRENRLASITQLQPVEAASAEPMAETCPATPRALEDKQREQRLEELKRKVEDGTYSVPADILAEILTRILKIRHTAGSQNTRAIGFPDEDDAPPPSPDDSGHML